MLDSAVQGETVIFSPSHPSRLLQKDWAPFNRGCKGASEVLMKCLSNFSEHTSILGIVLNANADSGDLG